MDPDTFSWLLTAAGQRLLDRVEDDATAAELRRTQDPERVAAAMTLADLRRHAAAKFGPDAARMYFTREALEQATRGPVAVHRAERIAAHGARTVADLGCGAGGDLVALARAGLEVTGIDADPLRAAMARANLAALGLSGSVRAGDVADLDTTGYDLLFADPARRSGAGRTFRVEDWEPPWSFLTSLFDRPACVKVAPGIPHTRVPPDAEAEWVSDQGELKEARLWSAPVATAVRRATLLADGRAVTLSDADDPGAGSRELGAYLHEPDDAVVRAGLVTAAAGRVGGGLLDDRIAWVTGDADLHTPFARRYRVREVLPFREKRLRAALRHRGIGRLTIKKRGVAVLPEQLRPRLALRGDAEATLVLTRAAGKGVAVLVDPDPA